MKRLLILILMGLAAGQAGAQTVFEAGLALNSDGAASLSTGKLWLKVDAQGNAEFDAAVGGLYGGHGVTAARLETPEGMVQIPIGMGDERVYSGCDPLGRNPFLTLPAPTSQLTCPALIQAMHFHGQFTISPSLISELLAERGAIYITQTGPADESFEMTGKLLVTGVAGGRQYYLTPVASVQPAPGGGVRLKWNSLVGSQYLVQLRPEAGGSAWESAGFIIVATSASQIIDIPVDESRPQRFFRVLTLR